MNREEIKFAVTKLTENERYILGSIVVGVTRGHHPITLDALFRKRLINFDEEVFVDRFGKLTINCPYVPINVHMAWCEWCAENHNPEDEEDKHD
jgi:hypothetical protein